MSANVQLQRLHELIESTKSGATAIGEFCKAFERIYNLELVKSSVPKDELRALGALFDKVVWYSPFPQERARIPQYLGEAEIRQALAHFDVRTSTSRLESAKTSGAQNSD